MLEKEGLLEAPRGVSSETFLSAWGVFDKEGLWVQGSFALNTCERDLIVASKL